MKRLTLGILAHVDAGKTTLSEAMLYRAGALRKLGRVDHGDAFLDTHALERARGITIFSKQAQFRFGETAFTLVDTPGHMDFSAETERAMQVLDYALLVINGAEGVQSHTETLLRLLARYRIPTFLFINKTDLAGIGSEAVLAQLARIGDGFVDFSPQNSREAFYESLALCDEALLEQYLKRGEIGDEAIRAAIRARRVFPCYFGAALKLAGVDELLSGLARFAEPPSYGADFGAKVFKIAEDAQGARLTYLKITGGSLRVKALLTGRADTPDAWEEKVDQIRLYSGAKYQAIDEALPGMLCAVTGLTHARAGDGLGAEADAPPPALEPVLSYRVELPPGADVQAALSALRRLEAEDPLLHVLWNEALGEIHVRVMGEVQLEVLQSLLEARFGLAPRFGHGSIVYKETIASTVEGVGHYEPLRHYAEVHLLLEPAPRGSGLIFRSACREDALARSWQRLILTHLAEKVHLGVLTGAPITDMIITLAAGRAHAKHTEGGDFRQATYRAVRQGLMQAQSVLLEPWYDFRLEVPQAAAGRAMTDLERMGAAFSPPEHMGESALLTGSAPVSAMRGYAADIAAYTRGKGKLSCTAGGYRPCPDAAAVVAAAGYDPEGDVANPADSVFCTHGAGHVVKWDQVSQYMHIESVLRPAPRAVEALRPPPPRPAKADDAELMRIFERTYGPIRSDPLAAFRRRSPERVQEAKPAVPPFPNEPDYLLVDGYNIIFAWEELAAIAHEDMDLARNKLINMLCNYRGFHSSEVILVFDAYRVKGNPGAVERVHNIHVVYTKEAETADAYIEKVTRELARSYRVLVATSDGLEQLIILGRGATRIPASAFREEVARTEAAMREELAAQQRRKSAATLAEARINPINKPEDTANSIEQE